MMENDAPFLQELGNTSARGGSSDEIIPRSAKNIPGEVDRRTLQICHIEATHCVLSTVKNDSITRSLPGTGPSEWIVWYYSPVNTRVLMTMMRPKWFDVVDAIEPNLVEYRERCTQSVKCM
jgi:hypothetical protein